MCSTCIKFELGPAVQRFFCMLWTHAQNLNWIIVVGYRNMYKTKIGPTFELGNICCFRYVPKTGSGPYLRLRRECACGQQGGDCFPGGYTDGLGANTPRELVMSEYAIFFSNNNSPTLQYSYLMV